MFCPSNCVHLHYHFALYRSFGYSFKNYQIIWSNELSMIMFNNYWWKGNLAIRDIINTKFDAMCGVSDHQCDESTVLSNEIIPMARGYIYCVKADLVILKSVRENAIHFTPACTQLRIALKPAPSVCCFTKAYVYRLVASIDLIHYEKISIYFTFRKICKINEVDVCFL